MVAQNIGFAIIAAIMIIGALRVVVGGGLYFINPNYMNIMFDLKLNKKSHNILWSNFNILP